MGWYKTCEICNKEGKYGLPCDCHSKASERLLASVSGRQLVEQKFVSDMFNKYLYQRFDNVCLFICLSVNGENSPNQQVTEISVDKYNDPYK